MNKQQDGGPAFPSEQGHIPDGAWNQTYESGMSLRDWFAGMALQGMLAYYNPNRGDFHTNASKDDIAGYAFYIANAMLEAREAPSALEK
jgi:hypothetical protein